MSYIEIAQQLGYRDRRAAHQAVLRGLAEPAEEDAALRGLRIRMMDAQLTDLQLRLWQLWEGMDLEAVGHGLYFRVLDSLLRISDRRCRLHGLYTHPYRYDRWYCRDVPPSVWIAGQRWIALLERKAYIPAGRRKLSSELAAVVPLNPPIAPPPVDIDALVPASVRRLLDAA